MASFIIAHPAIGGVPSGESRDSYRLAVFRPPLGRGGRP